MPGGALTPKSLLRDARSPWARCTAQLCDVRTGPEAPPGAGLSPAQLPRLLVSYLAAHLRISAGVLQDSTTELKFYYSKLRKESIRAIASPERDEALSFVTC